MRGKLKVTVRQRLRLRFIICRDNLAAFLLCRPHPMLQARWLWWHGPDRSVLDLNLPIFNLKNVSCPFFCPFCRPFIWATINTVWRNAPTREALTYTGAYADTHGCVGTRPTTSCQAQGTTVLWMCLPNRGNHCTLARTLGLMAPVFIYSVPKELL